MRVINYYATFPSKECNNNMVMTISSLISKVEASRDTSWKCSYGILLDPSYLGKTLKATWERVMELAGTTKG